MIGVPLNEPVQVGRKSTFEVFDEIRHKRLLSYRPLVIGFFDLCIKKQEIILYMLRLLFAYKKR